VILVKNVSVSSRVMGSKMCLDLLSLPHSGITSLVELSIIMSFITYREVWTSNRCVNQKGGFLINKIKNQNKEINTKGENCRESFIVCRKET